VYNGKVLTLHLLTLDSGLLLPLSCPKGVQGGFGVGHTYERGTYMVCCRMAWMYMLSLVDAADSLFALVGCVSESACLMLQRVIWDVCFNCAETIVCPARAHFGQLLSQALGLEAWLKRGSCTSAVWCGVAASPSATGALC